MGSGHSFTFSTSDGLAADSATVSVAVHSAPLASDRQYNVVVNGELDATSSADSALYGAARA
jgi:hypothetical protein